MSAQKLEVLDFIIKVQQEHEKRLDQLAHQLGNAVSRLETLLRYYEPLVKEQ